MRTPYVIRALVALSVVATASSEAHAQQRRRRRDVVYVYPEREYGRPAYVDRPLTTERRHLDLQAGIGYGYYDYYRNDNDPGIRRPLQGGGLNVELRGGVASIVEIGGGIGLPRFGGDSGLLGADRFARVDREWLPGVQQSGSSPYYGNPYARVRIAFLNYAPAMIGIEFYNSFPIAPGSCFGGGIGLPMAFLAGHRVRFETGVYQELDNVFCGAPLAGPLTLPLRINFQITHAFWLGIRTGLELGGVSVVAGAPVALAPFPVDRNFNNVTVPLGFQGGVRVHPRVDLMWHVVLPELLHNDPFTNTDVGFRAVVLGFDVLARLF